VTPYEKWHRKPPPPDILFSVPASPIICIEKEESEKEVGFGRKVGKSGHKYD